MSYNQRITNLWGFNRKILHEKGNFIITNYNINLYGQECPNCQKIQPFDGRWHCEICGSHSICGDPYWDEFNEEEYNSLEEKVLTLLYTTKLGNNIYKRLK